MSKWIDRFEHHTIHQTIRSILAHLPAIIELLPAEDVDARDNCSLIKLSVEYVQKCLSKCSKPLTSASILDNANNQLTAALDELTAFRDDRNNQHLEKSTVNLGDALAGLSNLPYEIGWTKSSVSSFIVELQKRSDAILAEAIGKKDAMIQEAENVRGTLTTLQGELTALRESLANEKASIANASAEYTNQFAAEKEKRSAGFAEEIKALKEKVEEFTRNTSSQLENARKNLEELFNQKLNTFEERLSDLQKTFENEKTATSTLSAQYQGQFSEAQEKRRMEFEEILRDLRDQSVSFERTVNERYEGIKQQLENSFWAKSEELQEKVDEIFVSLKEKDESASALLEAVGSNTHSRGYAGAATEERIWAEKLRKYALWWMILIVTILVGPAIRSLIMHEEPFDWEKILKRIPSVLIMLVPAFYLASEAAKHRKVQVENKRIELELAALTPYLATLGDEERAKAKEDLMKNYFIGHKREPDSIPEKEPAKFWGEVISKLFEKLLDRFPSLKPDHKL